METNLDNLIKKVLRESLNPPMKLTEPCMISEDLKYHLENRISLNENVFRIYSDKYFKLINEVRNLYIDGKIELNEEDNIGARRLRTVVDAVLEDINYEAPDFEHKDT